MYSERPWRDKNPKQDGLMKDIRSCSQLVIRLKIPYHGNVGQKSEKASLKAEGRRHVDQKLEDWSLEVSERTRADSGSLFLFRNSRVGGFRADENATSLWLFMVSKAFEIKRRSMEVVRKSKALFSEIELLGHNGLFTCTNSIFPLILFLLLISVVVANQFRKLFPVWLILLKLPLEIPEAWFPLVIKITPRCPSTVVRRMNSLILSSWRRLSISDSLDDLTAPSHQKENIACATGLWAHLDFLAVMTSVQIHTSIQR